MRTEDQSSAEHRWKLVADFVQYINAHRATNFTPSDLISVDESMSRWYGQGGHWIEHVLLNMLLSTASRRTAVRLRTRLLAAAA
jgi:hypothetical protein